MFRAKEGRIEQSVLGKESNRAAPRPRPLKLNGLSLKGPPPQQLSLEVSLLGFNGASLGEGPTWSLRALSRPQRNHPGLAASPPKARCGSQGSPNPGHWSRHNPEGWLLAHAAPPGPLRHLPEQLQGPPSGSQHFSPAPAPSTDQAAAAPPM